MASRRSRFAAAAVAAAAAAVIVVVFARPGLEAFAGDSTPTVATSGGVILQRTHQGSLIRDAFATPVPTRVLQDTYEFNGDVDPSQAFVHATAHGLRVGVTPPTDASDFTGWFAVTLAAYPKTSIFHVRMTKPLGNVAAPGREAEAVFAVQTASTKVTGLINFVEVSSDSLHGRTAYQVDYSWGYLRDAKTHVYWRSEPTPVAPSTQDVTIRTDGSHSLSVWLGSRQIFSSNTLHLDMEAPFQPYLEVQALHTPYEATFRDFWVTQDSSLRIDGLVKGTEVVLRGTGGTTLARARAGRGGTASLALPPYAAAGRATLIVSEPDGTARRLGPFRYAGGDIFRLTTSTPQPR